MSQHRHQNYCMKIKNVKKDVPKAYFWQLLHESQHTSSLSKWHLAWLVILSTECTGSKMAVKIKEHYKQTTTLSISQKYHKNTHSDQDTHQCNAQFTTAYNILVILFQLFSVTWQCLHCCSFVMSETKITMRRELIIVYVNDIATWKLWPSSTHINQHTSFFHRR